MVSEGDRPVLAHDLLLARAPDRGEAVWSAKDTILYNLGIGFGISAIEDPSLLRYLLADRLQTFPTMASVLNPSGNWFFDPVYGVDFPSVLHGEEAVELFRPLASAGRLETFSKIEGIWDRGPGKGAIMTMSKTLTDPAAGTIVASTRSTMVLRGNGGFGGTSEGVPKAASLPEHDPDGYYDLPTRPEQALTYQLSGDTNPLHTVPEVATAAGFPAPILMGLCNYATAARAIVVALADGDETRLRRFALRFSSVVYPGETIRTEYWRLGGGEVAFRARVVERDTVVLTGGRALID